MTAKATERDKEVLRTVMDKLVGSKKPMGKELAEEARQFLRRAGAERETAVSAEKGD